MLLLQVPEHSTQLRHVCVGDEWYRFPSSFHLPGPQYRLQFVRSGFTGLLPRPFSPSEVRCRPGWAPACTLDCSACCDHLSPSTLQVSHLVLPYGGMWQRRCESCEMGVGMRLQLLTSEQNENAHSTRRRAARQQRPRS